MVNSILLCGILDPAKVTRRALQDAASASDLLLTAEAWIAEAPKDDEHAHGGAPDGVGEMDMPRSGKVRYFQTFNVK